MGTAISDRLGAGVIAGGLVVSIAHHVVDAPTISDLVLGTAASFIPPLVAAGGALVLLAFVRSRDLDDAHLGRAAGWYLGGAVMFALSLYLSFAAVLGQGDLPADTWFSVVNWSIGGSAIGLAVANYDLRRSWALEQARENERVASRLSQRLSVVNRVLRHDVRNKLNIILGHVDNPGFEAADDEAPTAIEEAAESLLAIADRSSRLQTVLEEESPRPQRATSKVTGRVATLRAAYPDAQITIRDGAHVVVRTYPDVWDAIDELLENAIEHNPRPESDCRVAVSVSRVHTEAGAMGEIVVDDNGPGMPPTELVVMSEAAETQHRHSRETSLWMLRWIVDESNGIVSIETSDAGGTRIRIRLPEADATKGRRRSDAVS